MRSRQHCHRGKPPEPVLRRLEGGMAGAGKKSRYRC